MGLPLPQAWRRLSEHQRRSKRASREMRLHIRRRAVRGAPVDPVQSAQVAGLRYVNDQTTPGITRVGRKNRFQYLSPQRRPMTDAATLDRIRALAIPPAWTGVWICPTPLGHIQATGR